MPIIVLVVLGFILNASSLARTPAPAQAPAPAATSNPTSIDTGGGLSSTSGAGGTSGGALAVVTHPGTAGH